MFHFICIAVFLFGSVSLNELDPGTPLNMEACHIGDVIENECSRCTCTVRHVYECLPKDCNKAVKTADLIRSKESSSCHPHKIYHQHSTICICRPDGSWPHDSCYSVFRALPAEKIVKKICTGNTFTIIDCNICVCDDKGRIDNERCTHNECGNEKDVSGYRRKAKTANLFGNCIARNWYSVAPCQFCYCLRSNKLICNTGNNPVKDLRLGSYNFSLCGTDFLKEALELAPDDQKGGNILRVNKVPETQLLLPITEVTATDKVKSWPKTIEFEHLIPNIPIEVTREKKPKIEQNTESNEDYSEVKKKTKAKKEIGRKGKYTQQPNEELDYDTTEAKDDEKDVEKDSDPEEAMSLKSVEDNIPDKKVQNQDDDYDNKLLETFDLSRAIKNQIPSVLSKVFNIRKTVILDSHAKCEPGTRLTVRCNICHCMRNGKLLCTDKLCD